MFSRSDRGARFYADIFLYAIYMPLFIGNQITTHASKRRTLCLVDACFVYYAMIRFEVSLTSELVFLQLGVSFQSSSSLVQTQKKLVLLLQHAAFQLSPFHNTMQNILRTEKSADLSPQMIPLAELPWRDFWVFYSLLASSFPHRGWRTNFWTNRGQLDSSLVLCRATIDQAVVDSWRNLGIYLHSWGAFCGGIPWPLNYSRISLTAEIMSLLAAETSLSWETWPVVKVPQPTKCDGLSVQAQQLSKLTSERREGYWSPKAVISHPHFTETRSSHMKTVHMQMRLRNGPGIWRDNVFQSGTKQEQMPHVMAVGKLDNLRPIATVQCWILCINWPLLMDFRFRRCIDELEVAKLRTLLAWHSSSAGFSPR